MKCQRGFGESDSTARDLRKDTSPIKVNKRSLAVVYAFKEPCISAFYIVLLGLTKAYIVLYHRGNRDLLKSLPLAAFGKAIDIDNIEPPAQTFL